MRVLDVGSMDIDGRHPGGGKYSDGGDRKLTGGAGGGDDRPPSEEVAAAAGKGGTKAALAKLKQLRVALLAKHRTNCSGFIKEYSKLYAQLMKRPEAVLPQDKQANELIEHVVEHYASVDGAVARSYGERGDICYAVLKEEPNGHIMLVVGGPGRTVGDKLYPNVMGGGSARGYSDGSLTAADTYKVLLREDVKYYVPKPKPKPAPKPKPKPKAPRREPAEERR